MYVDSPEFFDRIELHYFLQEVTPVVILLQVSKKLMRQQRREVYLATWRFREPKGPCVHQRMLEVEVFWVMEDGGSHVGV
jgi:hypothetical protein